MTSAFGSVFTVVAIPLVAVHNLDATPMQTGLLAAAGFVPVVLLGLPIATWTDRLARKRPYLIGSDLLAASALGCLVIGAATGRLTIWMLAAFAFLLGAIGVFLETAYFSHLRCLVTGDDIVRARARLQAARTRSGGTLGRALTGFAAAGAAWVPFLGDLISYLVNACCLALIRTPEPPRRPAPGHSFTVKEFGTGLVWIRRDPFLRLLTPFLLCQQVVTGMVLALLAPFLLNELGAARHPGTGCCSCWSVWPGRPAASWPFGWPDLTLVG